jgi:glutamate synthase (NADPH/NADH) small chain
MGKPTGFLEWPRQTADERPVAERRRDYRELYLPVAPAEARQQAGRCMDCGVPFCQQGCPLGNLIPEWNHLVHVDDWRRAWLRLASTNNFPEFTGRLCPAPCEAACTLAINTDPVAIEQTEKLIVERAFAEGWVAPQPARHATGRRVAVVGSGPAGLAAAQQLARAGHAVTVFEAAARPGGLLRYGIPDFKLEKWVIDRRLAQLEAEGVAFRCGARVGVEPRWDELVAAHDAVLIAVGAARPRDLEVPGRELDGVALAMDFLAAQNEVVAGDRPAAPLDVAGRRVIVLGGGDTGSDCVGTAHRQGAASVTQIELMPAPPEVRQPDNPWPQWPLVFRTSSSQEEGGERVFALRTTRLAGRDGRVTALHGEVLAPPPGRAAAHPGELTPTGEALELPCDAVILAMGFVGPDAGALRDQLGVALDRRGSVAVDGAYRTSVPGVFAAGDARRGASLVVWAIAEGREAARSIDAALRDAPSWLPTRGQDQPFGGR